MNGPSQFGPRLQPDGTTFRLWAPKARRIELIIGDCMHPMQRLNGGWYEVAVAGAVAGTRYRFRLDDNLDVPDPASHFQPDDITGPSEVVDHDAFAWRADEWRGRPWEEAVFLECHVGTYTPRGDFRAMIEKLDHVVDSGVTAIELMPIADFAGRWNWGYDGVLWYAPDSTYGRPEDLKLLIDEAHLRGLMVFLDVVYNHFGPEGNYLARYAPAFFTSADTQWGSAVDYRVPEVRAFAIENAVHWLDRYRFDGLRLDAVHAIVERGQPPLLEALSQAVGEFAAASGRLIHLVLENDRNEARLLDPTRDPPAGKYRAQWNDDYHHAWHALLTGEEGGYYGDYSGDSARHLARTLSSGFAYQGEPSTHRNGNPRGEASDMLSPLSFVNFLQNHDQIGNRPLGDRLTSQANARALEAALSITLLAPMPPLLFMGEEWGSQRPFPFFCDFRGELGEAVRRGRRAEFKDAYTRHGGDVPDPLAEATVHATKLDWQTRLTESGRARFQLVRGLLSLRRQYIVPHLLQARFGTARHEEDLLRAHWEMGNGRRLHLLANLSARTRPRPDSCICGQPIFGGHPSNELPAFSVYWSMRQEV